MHKYKVFKLLFICLYLISMTINANESNDILFSIAAPESEPFVYTDNKGLPQGFLVEFFTLVKAQTGIQVNISILPWSRALLEVKKGNIDALMPTIYTKERAEYIVYSPEPLVVFNTVLLKRKTDNFIIEDITKVGNDLVIAKIRAMSMGKVFDDAERDGKISVVEVRDFDDAIKMLAKGRVDLVGCIDYIAHSSLKKLNLLNSIDIIHFTDKVEPAYLAFSIKYSKKENINELMSLINQVKSTAEYRALVIRFLK